MALNKKSNNKPQWVFNSGKKQSDGNPIERLMGGKSIINFACEPPQNVIDRALEGKMPKITFYFFELKGPELKDLLQNLEWKEYGRHWKESTNIQEEDLEEEMKRDAKQFDKGPIICCVITDENTEGLTGGEHDDGEGENYRSLIRDNLTRKSNATTGGSHGFGKGAYFEYSLIKTAFFFSKPEKNNGNDFLFVGRSFIPYRKLKGVKYNLGAHFGEKYVDKKEGEDFRRIEGREAEKLAKKFFINRQTKSTGTSIFIPGIVFSNKKFSTPKKIAEEIKNTVEKYYWPAIKLNKIDIEIKYRHRGKITSLVPDPDSSIYQHFCGAMLKQKTHKKITGSNQIVKKDFNDLQLPARKKSHKKHQPQKGYKPTFKYSVSSKDKRFINNCRERDHVALVRGHGKVVKYQKLSLPFEEETPIFAVLEVGEAVSGLTSKRDIENNGFAEEFFRSMEPPKHNKWEPQDETKRKYVDKKEGGRKSVGYIDAYEEFKNKSREFWVEELVEYSIPEGKKVSKDLRRLLGFGGGDGKTTNIVLRDVQKLNYTKGIWELSGVFENKDAQDEWKTAVTVNIGRYDDRKSAPLELSSINVSHPHRIKTQLNTKCDKLNFFIEKDPKNPTAKPLTEFEFKLYADKGKRKDAIKVSMQKAVAD